MTCVYWLPRSSSDLNYIVHESPGSAWIVENGDPVPLNWDFVPGGNIRHGGDTNATLLGSPSLKIKFLFASGSVEPREIRLSDGEVIPSFFAAFALMKLAPVTSFTSPGSLSTADICALTVCAKEYNISMTSGILRSETVLTSYSKLAKDEDLNRADIEDDDLNKADIEDDDLNRADIEDGSYTFEFPDNTNNFNVVKHKGAQIFHNTLYSGLTFEARMRDVLQQILDGELYFYSDGLLGDNRFKSVANMLLNGLDTSPDIPKTMDRIAAAMTNRLRDISNHTVHGLSGSMELYVRVSWPWLLLPICSVIIGTILLVSVMITTRKHKLPVWKTSELALLFHGLDFRVGNTTKMHEASEMEDVASALQVRLGRGCDGMLKLQRKSE